MADEATYWQNLERSLHSQHPGDMQANATIKHAVHLAKDALVLLAQVGHQFHLAEGFGEPAPDWPRLLFHIDQDPNGRLVLCEADAIELGAGWFDSLESAQHWDGVQTQFALKSGRPKYNMPAKMSDGPSGDLLFPPEVLEARARLAAARAQGVPLDVGD